MSPVLVLLHLQTLMLQFSLNVRTRRLNCQSKCLFRSYLNSDTLKHTCPASVVMVTCFGSTHQPHKPFQNQNSADPTWTDSSQLKLLLFVFHTEEFGRLGQPGGVEPERKNKTIIIVCKDTLVWFCCWFIWTQPKFFWRFSGILMQVF